MEEDSPYISRTPDGARDVLMMSVPIAARSSKAVLLRGEGMPVAVCVGSPDLTAHEWLAIVNRWLTQGRYDAVEPILMGLLQLDAALPTSGVWHLSTYNGDAGTFAIGTADPSRSLQQAVAAETHIEDVESTCCWMLTDADGPKLLVCPFSDEEASDSMKVAAMLAPHVVGEFCLARVDTATLMAGVHLHVPGWPLVMDQQRPSASGLR